MMFLRSSRGTLQRVTPRRTIAVALVTFIAVIAAESVAELPGRNVSGDVGHALFHLSWATLTMALALGIRRVRSAWPATGWTARSLALAQTLALVSAGGNVLAGLGVFIPFPYDSRQIYIYFVHPHNVGEVLGVGSGLILLVVCLVMLGLGVRGALRPRARPA